MRRLVDQISAWFVYKRELPERHYDFGGYYEWKVRKVNDKWKIAFVKP
jgi:hypothetical protein